jgi:uncharacterized protein (TIGR00725 family)
MRKIQIGVIGSMADVKIKDSLKEIAKKLGKEIAENGAVLVFGFEGDFDSLSTIAAKEAEKFGGQTLAFVWGSNKANLGLKSLEVVTGQERGGGREFPLVLSCDVIIAIGGGSGTLNEMAIAYQAGIPIVVIKGTGGWSDKLVNKFLDERKRFKIIGVKTVKEAVKKAISILKEKNEYEY